MSFYAELKRRNVFKVAIVYFAVAWLLLQVSDTLVPALHLPEWFVSAVAADSWFSHRSHLRMGFRFDAGRLEEGNERRAYSARGRKNWQEAKSYRDCGTGACTGLSCL